MMKVVKGGLIAKGLKLSIVVSRFNEFLSSKLLEGAVDALQQHGVDEKDISVFWVPGSFEIPPVAQKLARSKKYNAVICLGAIIRGDTPHFNYISNEVAKGIANVALSEDIPCIFGIITADTLEQAIERAGTKSGNKGRDAALSAVEMCDLYKKAR
ncbi:MAG: 6,7-dimethyl-8-ribityllumazine synthase [Omnitrophica bacterium RBG_13_46_9]|nr:MAG: 6,7-dimethyl-8-ribityllumazine synthase [Omnitrophica bacterium RBG_13_46_9]